MHRDGVEPPLLDDVADVRGALRQVRVVLVDVALHPGRDHRLRSAYMGHLRHGASGAGDRVAARRTSATYTQPRARTTGPAAAVAARGSPGVASVPFPADGPAVTVSRSASWPSIPSLLQHEPQRAGGRPARGAAPGAGGRPRPVHARAAIPILIAPELSALVGRSYPEIAYAVLRRFTAGVLDDARLRALCADAYDFEVPLEHVDGRPLPDAPRPGADRLVQGLRGADDGPLDGRLSWSEDAELVILTATSGDTGSAVAHAYCGVPRRAQRRAVPDRRGLDAPAQADDHARAATSRRSRWTASSTTARRWSSAPSPTPSWAGLRLSSANSINIGRLLPQAVYYVYAYVRLADVAAGEPIVFAVPSGNFGDMMGGVHRLADGAAGPAPRDRDQRQRRGPALPRHRPLREDRPVPDACISNAMNVGHPSNLARLVDLYGGWMDETGLLREPPDLARMRRDLFAVSIPDDETRATIRDAWQRWGVVLEPHGAVGWAGLARFLAQDDAPGDAARGLDRDRPPGEVPRGDPRADRHRPRAAPEPGRDRGARRDLRAARGRLRGVQGRTARAIPLTPRGAPWPSTNPPSAPRRSP